MPPSGVVLVTLVGGRGEGEDRPRAGGFDAGSRLWTSPRSPDGPSGTGQPSVRRGHVLAEGSPWRAFIAPRLRVWSVLAEVAPP
jgi:hypothetical protein